jgi:phosphohistidine phosphatase
VRARETLERLEPALTGSTVRVEDALYGASADELLLWLQDLPAELESVLLIGHDPGMQELALSLARPGALRDDVQTKFPTAALATLVLPASWAEASRETAELTAFVTPRSLG